MSICLAALQIPISSQAVSIGVARMAIFYRHRSCAEVRYG
jgi:hypothetical protein